MANTFTLIETKTLSTSTTSVTFSAIPATYTDLRLRISARTDYGATRTGGRLTVNADSSAIYDNGYIEQYDTYVETASGGNVNGTYLDIEYLNGTGAMANSFCVTDIYIGSYLDTTNRQMSMMSGAVSNVASDTGLFLYNMNYRGASPITSLTLLANTGNWVANSTFYLYGIKNS